MKILIKEVAQRKQISLYKVAQVLNLQQQTVYSWANERTQPSYKNMERLCNVLNCKLNDLFEVEK